MAMTTFEYRCPQDGDFEVNCPIGMAAPRVRCEVCGADAVRVFTAPMLTLAPRAVVAAIDWSESTRDEPSVVSSLPPGRGRMQPSTARARRALRLLPKP